MVSGCTFLSAKPSCPVCNTTNHVVSAVDKFKTTDFKCEKCGSVHYINNTQANFPEAGWDITEYIVISFHRPIDQNETVFIGDSGKKYTMTDITAYRQKDHSDFMATYLVQQYKTPQGTTIVSKINSEGKSCRWSKVETTDNEYEVTCTITEKNSANKTAKWKVNVATEDVTALNNEAAGYMS